MTVLYVTDNINMYCKYESKLKEIANVEQCCFERFEQISSYDILIVEFDKNKVQARNYEIIRSAMCKMKDSPILALLENSSVLDQFEVLTMGALDFVEIPFGEDILINKMNDFFRWKWYYEWEKKHEN